MKRRNQASIAANPVLIGAATVLVIVVAVFLAYNANSGLPFVPTYPLKADVPNAAQLVKGNEVRLGGVRVGIVDEIKPKRLADGRVVAQIGMQLDTTIKPLPSDSTLLVRPRSALGLKYVEITKGTGARGYEDGATIALGNATPAAVEFDEVLGTFDDKTRVASRANLIEFGNASLRIWIARYGEDQIYARVHAIPILVTSGEIVIEGPEEQGTERKVKLAPGNYRLVVAQTPHTEDSQFMDLFFERTADTDLSSQILVQDDELSPPPVLVESAETA